MSQTIFFVCLCLLLNEKKLKAQLEKFQQAVQKINSIDANVRFEFVTSHKLAG